MMAFNHNLPDHLSAHLVLYNKLLTCSSHRFVVYESDYGILFEKCALVTCSLELNQALEVLHSLVHSFRLNIEKNDISQAALFLLQSICETAHDHDLIRV